jgi:uncharacterized membrane protein
MMGKKRTKAFSAIFVALAAAVLFSISMSAAYAKKPIPISGKIIVQGVSITSVNMTGQSDNVIVHLSLNGMFTGNITGSYTSESRWVYHNYQQSDQWTSVHAVDTISATVTIDSVPYTGTLFFMLNGKGAEGGNWVIIGGTDDLANLHGQGTFTPAGLAQNYEGQIQFDP